MLGYQVIGMRTMYRAVKRANVGRRMSCSWCACSAFITAAASAGRAAQSEASARTVARAVVCCAGCGLVLTGELRGWHGCSLLPGDPSFTCPGCTAWARL
eukprot:1160081-Pelagomonas_calceolata.AAC.4